MPISFAAIGEHAAVGIIVLGIEHPTRSTVLRYAFPPQIGQVRAERRPLPRCRTTRALTATLRVWFIISRAAAMIAARAAAESSAAAAASTLQPAGLLGRRQCTINRWVRCALPRPLSRTRPSRTWRSSSRITARTRCAQS